MTGHPSEKEGKKCWLPFELPVFASHFLSICQNFKSSQKGQRPEPAGSLCLLPLFTAFFQNMPYPVFYFLMLIAPTCLSLCPLFEVGRILILQGMDRKEELADQRKPFLHLFILECVCALY